MNSELPDTFKDLEIFVPEWALGKFSLRQEKRLRSTMFEIDAFYCALMPRLVEVVEHLNRFPLDQLPEPEQRLLELCLSLANIGNCVALWNAPDQTNAFAAARMEALLDN
jgi:hypothetical protein